MAVAQSLMSAGQRFRSGLSGGRPYREGIPVVIETVFRCRDLPPADRFPAWRDMGCASHSPVHVYLDDTAEFEAGMRVWDLGQVQISGVWCPPLRASRTARLIRQSDRELYFLSTVTRGKQYMRQAGRELISTPGTLMLSTSSAPYEAAFVAERNRFDELNVLIPRALLPLPPDHVERLMVLPLPADDGIGRLVTDFLTHLSRHGGRYGPADAPRLSNVILDLVAALLGHHLNDSPHTDAQHRTLAVRVQAFIRQRLGDPDLTPDEIAAAHYISVRSLYRLFERQGTTVREWIREQRLDRTRRDLADPRQNGRPVHAIAARWGFSRPADFTRAFRAAYGMPPGQFRAMAHRRDLAGSAKNLAPQAKPTSPRCD